ncbi:hypothetical protein ACN9MN_15655 [Chryseobacterium sp. S-02]|uniref:hypothetical protein n=1 Tax=Chryseobacterium sp. S-02 TaxID=3404064 RepID=UPI003CF561C9
MNEPDYSWNHFGYREIRIEAYYIFSIPHSPFAMDIGYMDDLIRSSRSIHKGRVHYLAADLEYSLSASIIKTLRFITIRRVLFEKNFKLQFSYMNV